MKSTKKPHKTVAAKTKLTLILGSGFSSEADVPTTGELSKEFLKTPPKSKLMKLDKKITKILTAFWKNIFNYQGGEFQPTLEDHFTILDLAANSGHNVGPNYSPRELRAIRRMSIHRIFQILDSQNKKSNAIQKLLKNLTDKFDLSIINLNWDIVLEKHLKSVGRVHDYQIETLLIKRPSQLIKRPSQNQNLLIKKIPVLKVHGSSNWIYCDSCRRLYEGFYSKSALHRYTFLEKHDFELFGVKKGLGILKQKKRRNCKKCGNLLAGRVATFSYRKAFSIDQFNTIWERAYSALRKSNKWLFIGYSMPEADFEFKHLLKSAQFGRKDQKKWSAMVILKKDQDASKRFKGLFGLNSEQINQDGLKSWLESNSSRNFLGK